MRFVGVFLVLFFLFSSLSRLFLAPSVTVFSFLPSSSPPLFSLEVHFFLFLPCVRGLLNRQFLRNPIKVTIGEGGQVGRLFGSSSAVWHRETREACKERKRRELSCICQLQERRNQHFPSTLCCSSGRFRAPYVITCVSVAPPVPTSRHAYVRALAAEGGAPVHLCRHPSSFPSRQVSVGVMRLHGASASPSPSGSFQVSFVRLGMFMVIVMYLYISSP